jgi:hypothetical protein
MCWSWIWTERAGRPGLFQLRQGHATGLVRFEDFLAGELFQLFVAEGNEYFHGMASRVAECVDG